MCRCHFLSAQDVPGVADTFDRQHSGPAGKRMSSPARFPGSDPRVGKMKPHTRDPGEPGFKAEFPKPHIPFSFYASRRRASERVTKTSSGHKF